MDRKARYIDELNDFKAEAIKVIDAVRNSENLLQNITASSFNEMKSVYVQEAKKIIDGIRRQRLDKIREDESRPGSIIAKQGIGILRALLASKMQESEHRRKVLAALEEGYQMGDVEKAAVECTSEIVKGRVEDQTSGMTREEFLKALKGRMAIHKMLRSMFDEELGRLSQG